METKQPQSVEYNGGHILLKYFDGNGGWSYKVTYFGKSRTSKFPVKNCAWCKGKFYGEDDNKALADAKEVIDIFNKK